MAQKNAQPAAPDERQRCSWATTPAMIVYHDVEWGVPQHDDRVLFEFLILEGAQAGLSWSTILAKRNAYRRVFSNFNPKTIARYDAAKLKQLMANEGIVRNRLKIAATVQNARAFLTVQKEFGTFDAYIWQFVGGKPIVNALSTSSQIQARHRRDRKRAESLINHENGRFIGDD
ncbi:MAG: DNA-3-methyladenine glycosylase I [Candidatus Angelobacter sp.]